MRKFGDGPGIFSEWMYNTPFFEGFPCTWSVKSSIPHGGWRFYFILFC
jgi:hypothetical protein